MLFSCLTIRLELLNGKIRPFRFTRTPPLRNFLNDVIATGDQYFEQARLFVARERAVIGQHAAPRRPADAECHSSVFRTATAARQRHPRRRRWFRIVGERSETGVKQTDDIRAHAASMTRDSFQRRVVQAISPSSSSLVLSLCATIEPDVVVPGLDVVVPGQDLVVPSVPGMDVVVPSLDLVLPGVPDLDVIISSLDVTIPHLDIVVPSLNFTVPGVPGQDLVVPSVPGMDVVVPSLYVIVPHLDLVVPSLNLVVSAVPSLDVVVPGLADSAWTSRTSVYEPDWKSDAKSRCRACRRRCQGGALKRTMTKT